MAFVAVAIKFFGTLGKRQVVVVTLGTTYIKKIGTAFTGPHFLGIHTLESTLISLFIHCSGVWLTDRHKPSTHKCKYLPQDSKTKENEEGSDF
jgi:hypothetical protein